MDKEDAIDLIYIGTGIVVAIIWIFCIGDILFPERFFGGVLIDYLKYLLTF